MPRPLSLRPSRRVRPLLAGRRRSMALVATLAAALAGGLATSGDARAQGSYIGPREEVVYSGSLAALDGFTRCEPCSIDGDRAVDQAFLRGGALWVTLSPEYLRGEALAVHPAARDFAVLPARSCGALDALLVATDAGVLIATLPATGERFDLEALDARDDARCLRVADFDLDGAPELFVLRDDATLDVLDPGSGAWRASFAVPLGSDDFTVLRFDPLAATAQVAVRTPEGVVVLAAETHEPLLEIGDAPDFSLLARARTAGGREALARIVQHSIAGEPLPHQWLTIHWFEGSEAAIDLGFAECSSLVAGDLEGDGDDDLLVGLHGSYDTVLLLNGTSIDGPDLDASSFPAFLVLPLGIPGPAYDNDATPTLSDLDGDGDVDLFMNVEAIDGCVTIKSPIGGNEAELALLPAPSRFKSLGDGTWRLELTLEAPQRFHPGCDSLEIAWWQQPSLSATVEPGAIGRLVVPMPTFDGNGRATISIPFAEGGWMESIHHFMVRAVQVEQGEVIHAVSAATFGFATDLATRDTLIAQMNGEGWVAVAVDDGGSGPRVAPCGGTLGGGIISFPSLFSFGGHRP